MSRLIQLIVAGRLRSTHLDWPSANAAARALLAQGVDAGEIVLVEARA